ncbi:DNA polymerase/3'-5' exonuclease PolX [Cerasicoccus arenae]|uniref:DNA polymerase beta n=1 Tax=Cerasicoccus arenae TaxID=424488 RepID=A0A8J3DKS8_9BACT|nr:DNA polymerase/3'-5' exonuclease PolX [Cerasicoccus arenae]MBK1858622.1 DNA polymerase/3'-5' exonuclease PolX [Cerasicoccus arenae]GHC04942.1 DNA polymerase/3'-5' exonuclease PolX [Cerasicoccus arenae]
MEKSEIVGVLEEISELLELKGENPFKVRAYQSGARALESLEEDLGTVIEDKRLGQIKGIGKALVEKITSLHETGKLAYYDELKASVPESMIELLTIPNLGPKKIKKLHDELGIDSIDSLKAACEAGKVADLAGFGAKTESKLLTGIANRVAYQARHHWWTAATVAEPIVEALRELPEVDRAEAAGSLRRKRETVGDLDFIVASKTPKPVMDWFVGLEGVEEVTAHGQTKSSVRFQGGLQADLRVVPPEQFAFALLHFTGSKEHNVHMRQRALERGWSLSEWGLFDKDTKADDPDRQSVIQAESEADIYAKLGLKFVPPELREDRDEIAVAEKGDFPKFLEIEDIKGVFHNHTTASDGHNTLEEMVTAAQELGFEYLGIADHSKASFQANGLDEERLAAQIEKISELNASGKFTCHVFAGSEVDILKDGSLDFADDVLASLDYVVASVHNSLTLSEEEMTKRIIRAIENEHVTMLGHMTGRLLLKREAYAVNIPKVIDAAIANDTIIELNANPWRLDLDWRYWRQAVEKGLLTSINPDAHDTDGLGLFVAGVNVARKGWIEPKHVLNTRPLAEIKTYLGL